MAERDTGKEHTPEEIDRMIREGLDDIDRGDTIDGEEAFRQLRAESGAIDEGDASGVIKGNVFSRVRKQLNLKSR